VVPKEAIYTIAGLTKAFVVNNGKASERKVPPPSYTENGYVGVPVDQVKPGDLVAVSELPVLYDGAAVTVKAQTASALAGAKPAENGEAK